MDSATTNIIISTGGSVLVGIFGMFFTANQLGKRIDDFGKRIDDLGRRFDRLEDEFRAFKDLVNSKFATLDLEISKLMDRKQ